MAIETVIAGRYAGTYGATDMGFTREGWKLRHNTKAELINETDLYGESTIDAIHRGCDVFLDAISRVYKAGSTSPHYPWGALGTMFTAAAPIGRLYSASGGQIVLTATTGTPAAAAPATLTAPKSILPPESGLELIFNSKCRDVPLKWMLLPTETAGTGTWYATT